MSESLINTITTGVCALLTAIGGWFGKILWDSYKARRDNTISEVIARVKCIYGYLAELRRETKAVRVLVIKAHNGGGKPKLSGALYASVLYGDWEHGMSDALEWVNQKLDVGYIETLNTMLSEPDGWVDAKTETLSEGQLKDMLNADNVEHVLFCNLSQTEQHLVYLTVNFAAGTTMNAWTRSSIRSTINNMRALFKSGPVV
jgi:hypothetical protein